MKQETGSNPQITIKKVSIQLALDGHSFSAPGALPAEGELLVEVLTPRTMLVPAALFDPLQAAALLAMNGMPPSLGECAVWSEANGETIAVMAVDAQVIRTIASEPGIRPHYTTPLLYEIKNQGPLVWAYWTAGLLYIKVYDPTLRLAEVIPAPEDADIHYFVESLGREFPIGDYELHAAGEGAKRLKKLLGGWFRRIVVAKE